MKKVRLSVSIILLIFIFVFTSSCGSNRGTSDPSTTTGGQAASTHVPGQPPKMPLSDSGTTISIAAHDTWYSPVSFANNLPIWQEITKITGISFEWEVYGDDYWDVMPARLAAGVDLPDIFDVVGDPLQYTHLLTNLSDYMDYLYYTSIFFEEHPSSHAEALAPDGNLWFIPSIVSGTDAGDPYGWMVRKEWLEHVGMERDNIRTPDDLLDMLRAFRDMDPNQNGAKDEIPLSPLGMSLLGRIGSAWGLHLLWIADGWHFKDDTVIYEFLLPEYFEFVKYARILYEENLLDKEYISNTSQQLVSLVARDQVGLVTHFINNVEAYDKALRDSGHDGEFDLMVPFEAPGYKAVQERYGNTVGATGINVKSKNLLLTIQFLDWFYASQEGNWFMTFGIEGLSYTIENGEPVFTDFAKANPDGLGLQDVIRSLGGQPTICWIRSNTGIWSKQPPATIAHKPKMVDFVNRVTPYLEFPIPNAIKTPEEASEYSVLNTDITRMREEIIGSMIAGVIPLEEFDVQFIQRMKDMGVDRMIELRQMAHTRYYEASKK